MEYRKLISIEVRGDHIYSDKVSIGAVGTQNVTALDLFFDEQWEGLNPIVFWFNAMDHETQVAETILTSENKIEEGHYRVTIPHEVFEYKGNAAFVVEGTTVIDEAVVSLPTEYGYLIVRGSSNEVMDIPSEDDPLSILQQVQNLENLANDHAESARESASNAEESANDASNAVLQVYAEVDAAEGFAESARESAAQARGYAQTAQSYTVDAFNQAESANASASRALTLAAQAEASAEAAETQAQAAARSENNAAAYASQAQTYKSAAEMAQARVEASESAAQSYAAQAQESATAAAGSESAATEAAIQAALSKTAAQSSAALAQGYAEAAAQDFDTLSDELEAHTSDTDVHITPEERARWNAGGGGGGGTNDYNALSNKPSIGGVTLSGNKTLADLGFSTADCEKLSNKVTEIVRKTASDTNYPSEKAVSDALTSLSTNLNNSILGFYNTLSEAIARSEEVANKVTAIDGAAATDTHYPSEKAVADALTALSSSLSSSFGSQISGLSQSIFPILEFKEDSLNKSNSISGAGTSTNYPTTKAVVDYVSSQIGTLTASFESALDAIIGGE